MRHSLAAMIGGALALCSAPLLAAEEEAAEEDKPDWSVGLGVGLTGVGVGTGVGGLAGALPWFHVSSVERRIASGTWLTLSGGGGFWSSRDELAGDSSSWSVRGDIGLRQVFNPEDRFQVSIFAAVGPSYTSFSGATLAYNEDNVLETVDFETSAWDVHARGGVAVEQAFTDHIGMRLSVALLQAAYSESHADGNTTSGFSAGVGLSPQLDLRFRW